MYLSRISVKNFRGIKELEANFKKGVNVIIGENASNKSALIDSLRHFYCIGENERDIWVKEDDFYYDYSLSEKSDSISFVYEFSDLSLKQKGALYEYLVLGATEDNDIARITTEYTLRSDGSVRLNYYSGNDKEQKPSSETFELFQHYYLDPLRDSERMLLSSRRNIVGKLLNRSISRSDTKQDFEEIIGEANTKLMDRDEIKNAKHGINTNLTQIFGKIITSSIGLRIDNSKVDFILNTIKPFLPHNLLSSDNLGFNLWQNSLGFNNLIYFAVVLGDIRERKKTDKLSHFALLIEEPEAHLHPQLQLNLYKFLFDNVSTNTQLFITTHSPTVTSKVPLSDLALINGRYWNLDNSFLNRATEAIVQNGRVLSDTDLQVERVKVEQYLDVTKSQLFFSKGVVFVEGISEEILVKEVCKRMNFEIEDYQIEMINVRGVSFYPFMHFFNSTDDSKRLPQPVLVLTDDDRFAEAKHYSFDLLINDQVLLSWLANNLMLEGQNTRLTNLSSIANGQDKIVLSFSFQTLEFDIVFSNVVPKQELFFENLLVKFISESSPDKFQQIRQFVEECFSNDPVLSYEHRMEISCLLWKSLPSKSTFAQEFSTYLSCSQGVFIVPRYMRRGFKKLRGHIK